ncbi:MAG: RNA polymerase sigma factor [Actinobacteria bacterium]|nr:RNA polymerase sigma factor [Actinomycetota bacterium]
MSEGQDEGELRLEKLYAEHYRSVLAYVYHRVGNREDAEDIAMETFLRAWRRRESLPTDRDPRPWLYAIARNLAVDHYRRRSRQQASPEPLADAAISAPGVEFDRSEELPPLADLAGLRAAMMQLSAREREILFHSFSGRPYKDIAETLGVTPSTVSARLYRARRRLTELLPKEHALVFERSTSFGGMTSGLSAEDLDPIQQEEGLIAETTGRVAGVDGDGFTVVLVDEEGNWSILRFTMDDVSSTDARLIDVDALVVVTEHRRVGEEGPSRITRVRVAESEHEVRRRAAEGVVSEDYSVARRLLHKEAQS